MISRPNISLSDSDAIKRRDIVYESYRRAIAQKDTNVYFIDGYSLFEGENRDGCTVDGCHPNDLGFYRMANVIGTLMGNLLGGILSYK